MDAPKDVAAALKLQATVVACLDRQVPLPTAMEDWQTRHYALTAALADDLLAWMRWKNPGIALPPAFITEQVISFCADILVPFALDSAEVQRARITERGN